MMHLLNLQGSLAIANYINFTWPNSKDRYQPLPFSFCQAPKLAGYQGIIFQNEGSVSLNGSVHRYTFDPSTGWLSVEGQHVGRFRPSGCWFVLPISNHSRTNSKTNKSASKSASIWQRNLGFQRLSQLSCGPCGVLLRCQGMQSDVLRFPEGFSKLTSENLKIISSEIMMEIHKEAGGWRGTCWAGQVATGGGPGGLVVVDLLA